MCKVEVDLRTIDNLWFYNLSRFQVLSMALQDLRQLARGNKLHYIMDGYDFCSWFFTEDFASNPYKGIMKQSWNRFFEMSDGESTCAVLSPFTILEFLHTVVRVMDSRSIPESVHLRPDIQETLDSVNQGEQRFADLPGEQQKTVRALYRQILDHRRALDFFSGFDSFDQLKQLFEQRIIRVFDPLVPGSAQVLELLAYDDKKTENAINYLRHRRDRYSGTSEFHNTLDAYHFILVENSRSSLRAGRIVPYLTSSGIYSRNSWYLLKYDSFPNVSEASVPPDWNVRSGDVPELLLSALAFNNETVESTSTTEEFLEDARSIARIIRRDLIRIPEIQRCRENRTDRKQLYSENPTIRISSNTIQLIQRLDWDFLAHIADVGLDISKVSDDLDEINREEAGLMQEYLSNRDHYETLGKAAVNDIEENVRQLELPSPKLHSYIAPFGEGAEEFWTSITSVINLDS